MSKAIVFRLEAADHDLVVKDIAAGLGAEVVIDALIKGVLGIGIYMVK